MPGPLQQAGATVEPSEYSTLAQDEQFTGAWTQRSPLRDADVPWLYRKFYSASRFDSILDGINREITMRLTDARRPGSSVFNSSTWGRILGYYSFKYIQNGVEVVRLMVDTATAVYDGTPGSAGGTGKTLLWTKSAGAGPTRFLGVGPTLYMGNGVDQTKWIRSSIVWTAATNFSQGQFIVDTNNNLQLNVGSQQGTITGIQVQNNICTVFLSPAAQLEIPDSVKVSFSGLTGTLASTLNSTTQTITAVENNQQFSFALTHANVAFYAETGTVTTGTGTTGSTQPAWSSTAGAITQDPSTGALGAQWECRGSAVQQWMYGPPANAPTVTQTNAPSIYPAWAASTWYAPLFVIEDSNGNLQQLTTAGTTGSAVPTWATIKGNTTLESGHGGTAVWTCLGTAAWAASTAYALGAVIQATFTYYITVPQQTIIGYNMFGPIYGTTYVQQAVTVTCIFQCTVAGTSGSSAPSWTNGLGTALTDGTATWMNEGNSTSNVWPGATQTLSLATQILDSNNDLQTAQSFGESGTSHPTWATAAGSYTFDDNGTPGTPQDWLNAGPFGSANSYPWLYAYSGLNSVTGDITTASPVSNPITPAQGKLVVVQALGVQTVFDQIIVWRTTQGGSLLLYDSQIPNPGPNSKWIFTDTTPDTGLNAEYPAPVDLSNNPPPTGFLPMAYHGERIWGLIGSTISYSGGPDVLAGNGNDAFAPLSSFQMPEMGTRLWSVTVDGGGLLCLGTTNTYIILGNGTTETPYTPPQMYMERVGVLGYNESKIVGSTLYAFTNCNKGIMLDPSAGYVEIGFPIGDQFDYVTMAGIDSQLFVPGSTYVTWHEKSSGDTGLYFCDGATGWFRWSPIAPPESGSLWSVIAQIVGGTSAVQSVETAPGVFNLLIGPASSGPILFRDTTVNADWYEDEYQNFESYDVKGSIGLCESGEVAEIAHIGLKSVAVGARPTVSLLFDEIAAGVTVNGLTSAWDVLPLGSGRHEDPPNLEPSISMYSDRYLANQSGECPKCENLQLKVDYGSQNYPDELLKFAIYGATFKERKQQ
jgi:hypothetical protein